MYDIHQNPELENREFRSAELVAKHLQSLGIGVKTKVGVTGVVDIFAFAGVRLQHNRCTVFSPATRSGGLEELSTNAQLPTH